MGSTPPPPIVGPEEAALEVLAQWYDAPEPQECDRDEDCGTGCCRQIGTHLRQCYPDSDTSCHLRWVTLPPGTLPRWDFAREARFTASFDRDVIKTQVQEVWKSGDTPVYRLANGQYWEDLNILNKTPLETGAEVLIAPAELSFTMVAIGTTEARHMRQIPVVLDTAILSPTTNLETNGIYELDEGGGYWRVFGMTVMSDRRALVTTPNNVDFWIYTAGEDHNHVDPVKVFADGDATAMNGGFTVNDGTAWAYVIDNDKPVPDGAHVIVYNLTFYDDRRDDNSSAPYCWYAGLGYALGPWVSEVQ